MREVMSLRLSPAARTRLDEMTRERGLSAGKIVDGLIMAEMVDQQDRKSLAGGTARPKEVQDFLDREQATARRLRAHQLKEPVQDISATKKVRHTAAPVQGRTTLTGKPFGPIPKGK